MFYNKIKKMFAVALTANVGVTSLPGIDYYASAATTSVKETSDKSTNQVSLAGNTDISEEDEGVFKVTVDDNGNITADGSEYDPDGEYASNVDTPFSWDNVNMYFVITDRFNNGDKSNDHSYGRSGTSSTVPESYKSTFESVAGSYASTGEKDADKYESRVGTFHGGDLKGLTEYIENGYFDALGTNAIWITAPYEQVHGAVFADGMKHYAYHGYYALDYTEVDGNMGTAEDLEKFIDTAHEHGIRVVFDVVMNHSGYPDAYTIAEYYGANSELLTSKWQQSYFGESESSYTWKWDYSTADSAHGALNYTSAWNNSWYTTGWQRMVAGRYSDAYNNTENEPELTGSSTGLPDFKTEDSSGKSLPDVLSKKWDKEGRLKEKTAETNDMLSACGYGQIGSASVKQYLVAWLANWVREYGVDGFRCDTAKHVTIDCWKDLNTQCKKALNEWRKNNPTKPGAQWTDDFWMTGEVYSQGLSMNYGGVDYSQAFDSLINFNFQGVAGQKGSALESTYSQYASYCNSGSDKNALSYVSSHDKGIGARGASVGTALLLCPGGVQTYYGDETSRQAGGGSGDQPSRSQMTWNDKACLAHWQKVGRFRKNHIAVGAGQHKKISETPYTFSRTYTGKATLGKETKTDYTDKVVVSLPGSQGTYDIDVSSVFEDGTLLVDSYSGTEYTVEGGKVSATCDSNGVILLGIPTEPATPKAKVSASVTSGTVNNGTYSDDMITVKLTAENLSDATYTINDCATAAFTDSAEITIGADTKYEETTKIKVEGTSTIDQEKVSKEFTYQRSKEPTVGEAATGFYIRMSKAAYEKKTGKTDVPRIWVYDDDKHIYSGAAWASRDSMKLDESGEYYVWKDETLTSKVHVIVTDSAETPEWRSVPDGTLSGVNGSLVSGTLELDPSKEYTDSDQIKQITLATGEPGRVDVKYVDADGTVLKEIYRVGEVDKEYTVYAPETLSTISGYKRAEATKSEVTGKFTADGETIEMVYETTDEPIVTVAPSTPTPIPTPTAIPATEEPTAIPATEEPTAIPATEEPTQVPATTVPTPTVEPTQIPTNVPTASPTVKPTLVPDNNVVTPSAVVSTPAVVETPQPYTISLSASPKTKQFKGCKVKLTAAATGGSGTYKYQFAVEDANGALNVIRAYSKTATCTWTPKKTGTYKIVAYARDTGNNDKITNTEISFKVVKAPTLLVKKLIVKKIKQLQYQLTTAASGGTGGYKYKFTYTYKGKTKVIKAYSSTKTKKVSLKKKGTYKFTVYIKDSAGTVKKKSKTVKVK